MGTPWWMAVYRPVRHRFNHLLTGKRKALVDPATELSLTLLKPDIRDFLPSTRDSRICSEGGHPGIAGQPEPRGGGDVAVLRCLQFAMLAKTLSGPYGALFTRRLEQLDNGGHSDCRQCCCSLLLQLIMTAALSEHPGLSSSSVRAQDRRSRSVRKPWRGLALLNTVSGPRESRSPPASRVDVWFVAADILTEPAASLPGRDTGNFVGCGV
jgi:hypothetical protein